jgi:hypothetical protein
MPPYSAKNLAINRLNEPLMLGRGFGLKMPRVYTVAGFYLLKIFGMASYFEYSFLRAKPRNEEALPITSGHVLFWNVPASFCLCLRIWKFAVEIESDGFQWEKWSSELKVFRIQDSRL